MMGEANWQAFEAHASLEAIDHELKAAEGMAPWMTTTSPNWNA
jgi:hypothetical protein